MNDAFDYSVTVNGEKYDFCLREKGTIEITVDGSVKDAEIKISLCNPQ